VCVMSLVDVLPAELQLAIARRLDVRDRLALGAVCRPAASLVVHTAILEFRLGSRAGEFARQPCYELEGQSYECAAVLNKIQLGPGAVCTADPTSRKKGHLLPMYEAVDAASMASQISTVHQHQPRHHRWPWPAFTACGMPRFPMAGSTIQPAAPHHVLPIGLAPEVASLSLSDATLNVMKNTGTMLPLSPRVQASLKTSLVALDLSRAQHVGTVGCSGLGVLRRVRLPPDVRVACFDNCVQLVELRPTGGGARMLSLKCDGCRKLGGASFRAGGARSASGGSATALLPPPALPAPGAAGRVEGLSTSWRLESLAELDLSWCIAIDSSTLAELLPTAACLLSVGLRGLALDGVVEALLAAPARSLKAADFGFSSGLASSAVVELVHSHPALTRCNLRAASGVSSAAYNEAGRLMLARSSTVDVIENRRRPRHLSPRAAAPFYYLKRQKGGPFAES